jgi:hypothetical protein
VPKHLLHGLWIKFPRFTSQLLRLWRRL